MSGFIRLESLEKAFAAGGGAVRALRGVDLTIDRGEFLAVMGPSGSGKSTLLSLLGALDSPTGGRYLLEGADIAQLSDRELSRIRNRHFGFVFQSYNLFPELTALENVMVPLMYAGMGAAARRERALELLERLGLGHRARHHPNQLSGGEQQRVAVARALANNPSLILADEPTGNLPQQQGDEILQTFCRLNDEGVTIVLVTHDPRAASHGKRLVRLADGTVVHDAPLEPRFSVAAVAAAALEPAGGAAPGDGPAAREGA